MAVVLVEKQSPQITVVTLNRPERRNSLTIELLNELIAAIKVASDQPNERVLILRGAGAAFLHRTRFERSGRSDKSALDRGDGRKNLGDACGNAARHNRGGPRCSRSGRKPESMSACDFVVAAQKTKIGYPEVRRGLVPDW